MTAICRDSYQPVQRSTCKNATTNGKARLPLARPAHDEVGKDVDLAVDGEPHAHGEAEERDDREDEDGHSSTTAFQGGEEEEFGETGDVFALRRRRLRLSI